MFVTIRHLPQKHMRNMRRATEIEGLEIAKEVYRNNEYIRVADIEIDSNKTADVLDYAFNITNSKYIPWFKTEIDEMTIADGAKTDCRDTMIGDLIQINGKTFVVLTNSFEDISQYN